MAISPSLNCPWRQQPPSQVWRQLWLYDGAVVCGGRHWKLVSTGAPASRRTLTLSVFGPSLGQESCLLLGLILTPPFATLRPPTVQDSRGAMMCVGTPIQRRFRGCVWSSLSGGSTQIVLEFLFCVVNFHYFFNGENSLPFPTPRHWEQQVISV